MLSNPNSIRDHLYVEDFCRVLFYLVKNYSKFRNEIFNVSSSNYLKNKQIISLLIKLIDKNHKIKVLQKNNRQKDILTNSGVLLNKKLKNFKYTKFEKALQKTLIDEGLIDAVKL